MANSIQNTNIEKFDHVYSPYSLINNIIDPKYDSDIFDLVKKTRNQISNILNRNITDKFIVIIGPCSIHDKQSALDYAKRLSYIKKNYPNLLIIMRVYFEKPRTISGWKGLIMDPDLDNTCKVEKGLRLALEIMKEINKLNVPIACEFLDTISAHYISNFVSWGAIGARTTESQIHRQLASGLSMPIGFKNNTEGNIEVAINSILSSRESHTFLGINKFGNVSGIKTTGNQDTHIILRGGKKPNYHKNNITEVINFCVIKNIKPNIIVDCSHGNSQKNYKNQKIVVKSICDQIKNGQQHILGVMIESNINEGNQKLVQQTTLKYGVSITDQCISWEESLILLQQINDSIK
tara:strand:- start:418 stop:1467 length:1050 start_codon:yes stop_codon:yes gene_type:complete